MSECTVCHEKLFSKEVAATHCGHIYHYECIKQWVGNTRKDCPFCRKAVTPSQIFQLFPPEQDETKINEIILTRIQDVFIQVEKGNKQQKDQLTAVTASLEKLTTSLSAFEYQNEMLRKENEELKELMKNAENESRQALEARSDPDSMRELLKQKDLVIATLKKENQELKLQRAETAKQMIEIQNQIAELKDKAKENEELQRNPLRAVNNNEPKQMSLSLKFDDFCDRMIIQD